MAIPYNRIVKTLRFILNLFVLGDYDALEKVSNGVRLTAEEMKSAIREYGDTISMPPDIAFRDLDIIEIVGTEPQAWSVRFDLWTEKEGVSDLSLELTLIDSANDLLQIEIDNIHVM